MDKSQAVYIARLWASDLPPFHPIIMGVTNSTFELLQMHVPKGRDIWLMEHHILCKISDTGYVSSAVVHSIT